MDRMAFIQEHKELQHGYNMLHMYTARDFHKVAYMP